MGGDGREYPGRNVCRGAYLEWDGVFGEVVDEILVLSGRDPVADAVQFQRVGRVPDGVRPEQLAGVGGGSKAGIPGRLEYFPELPQGEIALAAGQGHAREAVELMGD